MQKESCCVKSEADYMLAGGTGGVQRTSEIYVREPNAQSFFEFNVYCNSLASDRDGMLPHIFRSCAASTLSLRSFPPLDLVIYFLLP